MKRPKSIRWKDTCLITPSLYRDRRRTRKQRCEEDLILNDKIGTCGQLPTRALCSVVAGARGHGEGIVPEMECLFCDAGLARLVGLDVVREEVTLVIMGHIVHVGMCAIENTLFVDRADIVAFSVIIPGKNL